MTANRNIGLRPIPEAIGDLHAFIGSFLKQVSPENMLRDRILLASHEVFTNLIKHSNHTNEEPVKCQLRLNQDEITVSFIDHGVPFDLSKQTPSVPDPVNDRGFGIFIIHQLVESLSYRSLENGANELSMLFAPKM